MEELGFEPTQSGHRVNAFHYKVILIFLTWIIPWSIWDQWLEVVVSGKQLIRHMEKGA